MSELEQFMKEGEAELDALASLGFRIKPRAYTLARDRKSMRTYTNMNTRDCADMLRDCSHVLDS